MTNEEAIVGLMNSVRNLELITRSRHLQKVHIGYKPFVGSGVTVDDLILFLESSTALVAEKLR